MLIEIEFIVNFDAKNLDVKRVFDANVGGLGLEPHHLALFEREQHVVVFAPTLDFCKDVGYRILQVVEVWATDDTVCIVGEKIGVYECVRVDGGWVVVEKYDEKTAAARTTLWDPLSG